MAGQDLLADHLNQALSAEEVLTRRQEGELVAHQTTAANVTRMLLVIKCALVCLRGRIKDSLELWGRLIREL